MFIQKPWMIQYAEGVSCQDNSNKWNFNVSLMGLPLSPGIPLFWKLAANKLIYLTSPPRLASTTSKLGHYRPDHIDKEQ